MCRPASTILPLFFGAIALSLGACAGPQFSAGGRPLPTPEEPGLYVLTAADELRRIDGSPEWERKTWPSRSNFSPDSEFIIYEPGLAGGSLPVDEAVALWRVAWLRSELETTGYAAPVRGSQWVVAELQGWSVPMVPTPHPVTPGILHFGPETPLDPGLYELRVRPVAVRGRIGRIGIRWNTTDKRTYSAQHCVDRVVGGTEGFRPCTSSTGAFAGTFAQRSASAPQVSASSMNTVQPGANTLKIELHPPQRESGRLLISGGLRNTSEQAQAVPMLKGTILDGAGSPLDSWVFAVPARSIHPNGRVAFATWRPAPDGAARINVDFVKN